MSAPVGSNPTASSIDNRFNPFNVGDRVRRKDRPHAATGVVTGYLCATASGWEARQDKKSLICLVRFDDSSQDVLQGYTTIELSYRNGVEIMIDLLAKEEAR